jgi:hypothetical protein
MVRAKMLDLTIRIKKNDELHGKRLEALVLDLLTKAGIAGATVWTGVDGFGKRGKSTVRIEGISINMPMLIEAVDARERIEPLLPEIKSMVGDNGLMTLSEVEVV